MKNLVILFAISLMGTNVAGQINSSKPKRSMVEVLRVGQIVSFKSDSIVIESESEKTSAKFAQNRSDVYKVVEIGRDFVALQNQVYDRYVNSRSIRQIIRKRSLPHPEKTQKLIANDSRKAQLTLIQSIAKKMVDAKKMESELNGLRREVATSRQQIKILRSALDNEKLDFVFNGVKYTGEQVRNDLAKRVKVLGDKEHLEQKLIGALKDLERSILSQEEALKEMSLGRSGN